MNTIPFLYGELNKKVTPIEYSFVLRDTFEDFPELGSENKLYFDKSSDTFYIWNKLDTKYDPVISLKSGVISVNGKVGNVVLNASDVGALSQSELQNGINAALQQAKESGEFDGDDYVLTEADKQNIADLVFNELPDLPTDGGEWERIVDYTVPEGVTVDSLDFTKDLNGNDFELKKAIIYCVITGTVSLTGADRDIKCITTKNSSGTPWANGQIIGKVQKNTEAKTAYVTYVEPVGDTYYWLNASGANNPSVWYAVKTFTHNGYFDHTETNTGLVGNQGYKKAEINRFYIASLGTDFLGAGSTIKIMGVRK